MALPLGSGSMHCNRGRSIGTFHDLEAGLLLQAAMCVWDHIESHP